MKIHRILAIACAGALLAGCGSGVSDEFHSVLGPRQAPKSRTYQASQKATYEAVKAAADAMGYRFVRGGPAEGQFYALSAISEGEDPGSSHQIAMRVSLSPAAESGTEVEISLTEMIEEPSPNQPAMATETPLRDTPLYEVFFRSVQTALTGPVKS
jgi:hypothetical protein